MNERGPNIDQEESLYKEYDYLMNVVIKKLLELVVVTSTNTQFSNKDNAMIKEFSIRRNNIFEVWINHQSKSKSNTEKIKSYGEIIPMLKELVADIARFKNKKNLS